VPHCRVLHGKNLHHTIKQHVDSAGTLICVQYSCAHALHQHVQHAFKGKQCILMIGNKTYAQDGGTQGADTGGATWIRRAARAGSLTQSCPWDAWARAMTRRKATGHFRCRQWADCEWCWVRGCPCEGVHLPCLCTLMSDAKHRAAPAHRLVHLPPHAC